MLRIYRLVSVYRHVRKSVAQTSVTVGILRLMPLILGITHIYGCIWWYLGTVGQPHTQEEMDARGGAHRSTWVYFYEGLGEAHLWSDKVCRCIQHCKAGPHHHAVSLHAVKACHVTSTHRSLLEDLPGS